MNKDKRVRFAEPVTSSSNIPKQNDSLQTKDSNKPLLTSIGVKKNNMITPGSKLLNPGTISSGLVPNIPSSTSYVSPTKNDWEILFQPMFDEYLNPPPYVDPQVPTDIAPEPVVSTDTPSSTIINQDAPSTSTSQTPQETAYPVIPFGVRETNHDIEIAHMNNNPFVEFLIPEPSFKESSTQKFTKDTVDPTLFVRRKGRDILLVQICVDDIIFASTKPGLYEMFSKIMCSKFQMSMMGKISFFLGLQISQSPIDTPMVEKFKLDEDPQGKAVNPTHYHGMIGTLMYLTASRPDLVFDVCPVSGEAYRKSLTCG
uniref:Reverse transcriptase Ty1/copia-type domain-containing protein n=1 Tax=Tanacetum cinerariifolium TaxID=118510 RepID=A0A6L2MSD3_TANCI|nr:hypothetical protein [Tanacetum cinerariifolium]